VLALIARLQIDRERSFSIIALIAALLTFAIGAFMVIAWHSHSEWLHVTFPNMFYMKYNTSLAFMAGGAGLFACARRERILTIAAAGVVLAIGGITLTQYATGVSLGFDELFLKDYWYPENPLRGRMAPSASVALTSVGIMLILLADEGKRAYSRVVAMEVLSFVVLAVGTTAVVGYLANAGFAYSWGSSAHVSPVAAAGYMAMGVSLVALTWQRQSTRVARVPLWVPALLGFTVLVIDLSTPRGLTLGIGYVPIIFCSLWFTQPYMAFVFALITSGLTLLGYFAKPPSDVGPWVALTNRALTIGALWFVATLVYMRRRAELLLQGSMDQLERSNQELDDFAYIASHDLKEPLRGLFNHAPVASQPAYGAAGQRPPLFLAARPHRARRTRNRSQRCDRRNPPDDGGHAHRAACAHHCPARAAAHGLRQAEGHRSIPQSHNQRRQIQRQDQAYRGSRFSRGGQYA